MRSAIGLHKNFISESLRNLSSWLICLSPQLKVELFKADTDAEKPHNNRKKEKCVTPFTRHCLLVPPGIRITLQQRTSPLLGCGRSGAPGPKNTPNKWGVAIKVAWKSFISGLSCPNMKENRQIGGPNQAEALLWTCAPLYKLWSGLSSEQVSKLDNN